MKLRLSIALFLILSIAVFPWWLVLLLALLAIKHFSWYYEIVAVVLVYDLLYSLPIFHFSFWLTAAFVLLVPLFEWLKKELYVFSQQTSCSRF